MEGPPRFPHVPLPAAQPGVLAASTGGFFPKNVYERFKLLGKQDARSADGSNGGTGRMMESLHAGSLFAPRHAVWARVPLSSFLAEPATNFSICFAPATGPCRSASGCQ